MNRKCATGVWAIALGMILGANPVPAEEVSGADYGFLPPEIYKLDFQIKNLLSRDVNGDGKLDVVVVNNLQNRIDVLEQRRDPRDRSGILPPTEANELTSFWRLKHRKIAATRNIAGLEVRDISGDGRADLVYVGDPPGLYVEYQDEQGQFSRRRSFENRDVQQNVWSLDVGDLNGDGRPDVAYLGNENLYIVFQQADGQLEEPKRYRLAESGAGLLRILDFNDDGANDVVYIYESSEFQVRVRFGNQAGRLGPELRFKIDKPRGISYSNVDGKPGEELLSISSLTDRLVIHTLAPANREDAGPTSQLVVFPLEKSTGGSKVDVAIGDFDGDRRTDLLVADSASAGLLLYRQTQADGLDQGQTFPGMSGAGSLRATDVNGDGVAEALVLSSREKSIALTRFDDGRLAFPRALPTMDEPVVMEVIGSGPATRVVFLTRRETSSGERFFLRQIAPTPKGNGTWSAVPFGDQIELAVELSGRPADLKAVDANGDGRLDLVFFFDFDPAVLWLANDKGSFTPAPQSSQGTLGKTPPAGIFFGKLNTAEPTLLAAQSHFARNLVLGADGHWHIRDQYNAADSGAAVTGITALDLDGDKSPELAMYDRNSRAVVFLKLRDGLYQRWQELKVGAFTLRGMRAADFNNDGKSDLLLFDSDKLGIAYGGKADLELKQIANYETDVRGGKLFDMVPGDLNGDGRLDLLVIEPLQHHLEVVAVLPEVRLRRVAHWKVFEEKTFRRGIARSIDPREAVIGDVDHDGFADVVVLAHDRVLVYLQDAQGRPAEAPAAALPAAPAGTGR